MSAILVPPRRVDPTPVRARRPHDQWRGRHLPEPRYDGVRWRCGDCGMLLTAYHSQLGERRLRHHPRGKR